MYLACTMAPVTCTLPAANTRTVNEIDRCSPGFCCHREGNKTMTEANAAFCHIPETRNRSPLRNGRKKKARGKKIHYFHSIDSATPVK